MRTVERNPLLSVIVPVYNAAPCLRQCIESIIHQTYHNLEIILVADGGSTDGSTEICEEYAAKDKRIKVLHRPHEGLAAGRKAGVREAGGEYVAYVDSDDWIDLNAYEELFASMGEQSPDVLIYDFIREYEDRGVVCQYGLPVGYYDGDGIRDEIYPRLLSFRFPYQWEIRPGYAGAAGQLRTCSGPKRQNRQLKIYPGVWTKLVRLEILEQSQMMVPDMLITGEDLACTIHTLFLAQSVMVTDIVPYHYRIRADSLARADAPFMQYQMLFTSAYHALRNRSSANVYLARLSYLLLDAVLLHRYERFLEGAWSNLLFGNLEGCRVALYGAGKLGKEIYRETSAVFPDRIVLWVDQKYEACRKGNLPVEPVEALQNQEYDAVIVALVDEEICEGIKRDLIAMGIASEKIRCISPTPEVLKAVENICLE